MIRELLGPVARALAGETDRWSLILEGEDPRAFLHELVRGLKGDDRSDHRKRVPNKHRYVGLSPTVAWLLACRDPSYPVMYDSLEAFARLWDACQAGLISRPYHYVSLGVGTGDKDRHVLDRLSAANPDLVYVPVDISSHMLRLGTAETARRFPGRVLPIELDFERPSSLRALRRLLAELLGDEPILFSLLGSSLANIDDDAGFLRELAGLLRPQDRLVLEVAVTDRLEAGAAAAAAAERMGSRLYNEFVTTALAVYTDLTIDTNWLRFTGGIEPDKALRVEGQYTNLGPAPIPVVLPNREVVPFGVGEGIEVLLGRKYLPAGLRALLTAAELAEDVAEYEYDRDSVRSADGAEATFGLAITVLRRDTAASAATTPLARVWQVAPPAAEPA